MKISFLVTGEGVSDLRLTEHIESVLIEEGFTEVSGEAPDLSFFNPVPGRSVPEKIRALLRHYPNIDLLFVHRDADGAGIAARQTEVFNAATELGVSEKVVPIIPVRTLEAWLLSDLELLKEVAGNRSFGQVSCIPSISRIEHIGDPKSTLLDALCEISCAEGSKLKRFKSRFGEMRARLTFGLNPNGPIRQLPSYKQFREQTTRASQALLRRSISG